MLYRVRVERGAAILDCRAARGPAALRTSPQPPAAPCNSAMVRSPPAKRGSGRKTATLLTPSWTPHESSFFLYFLVNTPPPAYKQFETWAACLSKYVFW